MNDQVLHCDEAALRRLLEDPTAEGDLHNDVTHIEQCPQCQFRLESLAADESDWHEVQQAMEAESPSPERFTAADRHQTLGDECSGALPYDTRRDVLETKFLRPSHPEMLGRLDRYEIEKPVGSGGMGLVYKAYDSELNRTVAIKMMSPHLAGNGAARTRFSREARAAASIVHDNVVSIHDVLADNDPPFLVMQFVAGETLQNRIDRQGPLDLRMILRIASQTASALAAAHEQGLVHRDVKPSNILLEGGVDRTLLADFGLVRACDDATLTHSGLLAGTPHYMSPEQARGESADHRSDLYSLGCVMYAMCTGRPPFRAESSYGVLRRITDKDAQDIQEINCDVPIWLVGLIERLMEKDPQKRFQSASEVAVVLSKCLAHLNNPTRVPLPPGIHGLSKRIEKPRVKMMVGLLAVFTGLVLGVAGHQATMPPEIAGQWQGPDWGNVVLAKDQKGFYTGTYDDTFGGNPGSISLQWSRMDRRFYGTWSEGTKRFGKLSVRIDGEELRGAWTTSKKSEIHPKQPALSDLCWTRRNQVRDRETDQSAAAKISQKKIESFTFPGRPLSHAVAQFNLQAQADAVGRLQPLLTDDEMIAAINHWCINPENDGIEPRDLPVLKQVAEDRYLPDGWSIQFVNTQAVGGVPLRIWTVQLTRHSDGVQRSKQYRVRERYLGFAGQAPLPVVSAVGNQNSLNQLVAAFNHKWNLDRINSSMPPLTVSEVLAAVFRETVASAGERSVEIERALKEVLGTRTVPVGATLELGSGIHTGESPRFHFLERAIDLRLPDGAGKTSVNRVRSRFLKSVLQQGPVPDEAIDWGPVAEDGLQVGIHLESVAVSEIPGQHFVPTFFFRNEKGETKIAFEHLIRNYVVDARTATGIPLRRMHTQDAIRISIPVIPMTLSGLQRVERPGAVFSFADIDLDQEAPFANWPINVTNRNHPVEILSGKPNQSIRIRIKMPHPILKTPLVSGEKRFSLTPAVTVDRNRAQSLNAILRIGGGQAHTKRTPTIKLKLLGPQFGDERTKFYSPGNSANLRSEIGLRPGHRSTFDCIAPDGSKLRAAVYVVADAENEDAFGWIAQNRAVFELTQKDFEDVETKGGYQKVLYLPKSKQGDDPDRPEIRVQRILDSRELGSPASVVSRAKTLGTVLATMTVSKKRLSKEKRRTSTLETPGDVNAVMKDLVQERMSIHDGWATFRIDESSRRRAAQFQIGGERAGVTDARKFGLTSQWIDPSSQSNLFKQLIFPDLASTSVRVARVDGKELSVASCILLGEECIREKEVHLSAEFGNHPVYLSSTLVSSDGSRKKREMSITPKKWDGIWYPHQLRFREWQGEKLVSEATAVLTAGKFSRRLAVGTITECCEDDRHANIVTINLGLKDGIRGDEKFELLNDGFPVGTLEAFSVDLESTRARVVTIDAEFSLSAGAVVRTTQ